MTDRQDLPEDIQPQTPPAETPTAETPVVEQAQAARPARTTPSFLLYTPFGLLVVIATFYLRIRYLGLNYETLLGTVGIILGASVVGTVAINFICRRTARTLVGSIAGALFFPAYIGIMVVLMGVLHFGSYYSNADLSKEFAQIEFASVDTTNSGFVTSKQIKAFLDHERDLRFGALGLDSEIRSLRERTVGNPALRAQAVDAVVALQKEIQSEMAPEAQSARYSAVYDVMCQVGERGNESGLVKGGCSVTKDQLLNVSAELDRKYPQWKYTLHLLHPVADFFKVTK